MRSDELVRGAILAQQNAGGDLVDTLNTNSFKNLPIKEKVNFVNQYAASNGPEPQNVSKGEALKRILGSAVGGFAAGGAIGIATHVARGGHINPALLMNTDLNISKEMLDLKKKQLMELSSRASGGGQIGALIGAGHAWSASKQENRDAEYVRNTLGKIRQGDRDQAVSLAIGGDYLHGRRATARSGAGFSDIQKMVKDNLIF